MSGYGEIGKAFVRLFDLMTILLCVSIPLGMWKLVDIAIWLYDHFTVSFGG